MRAFNLQVFDDIIVGTGNTWYTSSSYDAELGTADALSIFAVTTGVSGTSPTLTVQVENSGDDRDWVAAEGTAEINAVGISNGFAAQGNVGSYNPPLLQFVRLKITLAGTSPQCRLKLYVTGRTA